ncbi:MAG: hypothetical protein Udaeo2_26300 [Candidatus Udaeobacter sp.]|nr:MAG: hypothetical protein Udaeo2_26300 [Candidatus Udaeobacter sp.]
MKALKYIVSIAALTAALTLSASATFMVDPDPSGKSSSLTWRTKAFQTSRDSLARTTPLPPCGYSHHGKRKYGQRVRNHQTDKRRVTHPADFHSENGNLFADFSFRGQLEGMRTER